MPFNLNSIDVETFDDMQGILIPPRQKLELFQRKGIEGTGARKTGIKGDPFTIITVKYVADFTAARDAVSYLQQYVGFDPVNVIKHSVNYGKFLILEVFDAEDPQACLNVVGSIILNPTVRQVLKWKMIG